MLIIAEAERLLKEARKSIQQTPRNNYEAQNQKEQSMERIKKAIALLCDMSGASVDQLRAEAGELEHTISVLSTAPTNDAFQLDFSDEDEAAEEIADEVAEAERQVASAKSKRTKTKNKSSRVKGKEKETPSVDPCASLPYTEQAKPPEDTQKPTLSLIPVKELDRYDGCSSDELPQWDMGSGVCMRLPGTPLVIIDFASNAEHSGKPCRVRVELYRVVLLALMSNPSQNDMKSIVGDALISVVNEEGENCGDGEEEDGSAEEEDTLCTLSKQLVHEYNETQEMEEEAENSVCMPHKVPAAFGQALRHLTTVRWVILLCHGGYFAGGVYFHGQCLLHKAFQRYVVRKKQGGKQSSNEKDGGSYNSIGSLIRKNQEVKWRLDVRNILLAWRAHIDAAAVILYVAPGPQNRSVLMDFSSLPPVAGDKGVSPVAADDPRVHKVPLTTHRPSFSEVQRIFDTVARCNVVYVESGGSCSREMK